MLIQNLNIEYIPFLISNSCIILDLNIQTRDIYISTTFKIPFIIQLEHSIYSILDVQSNQLSKNHAMVSITSLNPIS